MTFDPLSPARLGQPIAASVAAIAIGFMISAASTRLLIGWLAARQFGKAIRVDGPDHRAKSGTPTMGGLGMLLALLAVMSTMAYLLLYWGRDPSDSTTRATLAFALGMTAIAGLGFGGLGLVDDLQGLARKRGAGELGVGLGARQMLALQTLLGLVLGLIAVQLPSELTRLPTMPAGLVALLVAFVVVGTANGVNLSDGLDGLAAGLLAIASGCLGLLLGLMRLSWYRDRHPGTEYVAAVLQEPWVWWNVGWLALTITGACLGFLVYNRHPARVFMGNVASMGLGGVLATLFIISGLWWLLPIFGAVFVAEVVSDIIQIGYFRRTGGKRFFRMAPLHHHFELGGMHETQVVRRFWAAGLLAGSIGLVLGIQFM